MAGPLALVVCSREHATTGPDREHPVDPPTRFRAMMTRGPAPQRRDAAGLRKGSERPSDETFP